MRTTISNQLLCAEIDSLGAQLCSLKSTDGTEYLWEGDPAIWKEHAPNLFPYIGRMTDKSYTWQGKTYPMNIHGIAKYREFELEEICENRAVYLLKSDEETLASYPFAFAFRVIFTLEERSLQITYRITNAGETQMYYAVGGHPGFCVPNTEGTVFGEYYLEFEPGVSPRRIAFSDECLILEGEEEPYTLHDGKMRLTHDLFDRDAVVLIDSGHSVALKNPTGRHTVRVTYPDMPYVGFWHKPHTEAPYVCVEPWSSLPSRQGVVEDLAKQENLCSLEAGQTFDNNWSIEIEA